MTPAQDEYNKVRIETFVESAIAWFDPDRKLIGYERALLTTLDQHEQSSSPMAPRGHGWLKGAIDCIAEQLTSEDPNFDPYTMVPNPDELRRIVNHSVERGYICGTPWNLPGSILDWSDLRITAAGSDLVATEFPEPERTGVQVQVGDNFTGDLAVGGRDVRIGNDITVTFNQAEADETLVAVLQRMAELLDNAQDAALARDIAGDPDPTSRRRRAKEWLDALATNAAASCLVEIASALVV